MKKVNYTSNKSKTDDLVFGVLKIGESLLNLEIRLQNNIDSESDNDALSGKENRDI